MDELDRHLNAHNYAQRPSEQEYQIYNVRTVLSWIRNSQADDPLSAAQTFAVDFVKERALELGKQEWLADPWGRQNSA